MPRTPATNWWCGKLLNIISLSSVNTDFSLSLPAGTTGITLSATSGTTPAQVMVTIDPAAFQGAKGTTSIPLTLTSNGAVNLPAPLRLLINTRDFNQRGQIVNIPGKLVDILTDQARSRLYILRQDIDTVLVYDAATLQRIAFLRTGNTPTQMAFSADQKYLIVGNDNSQIANVFDLDTLSVSRTHFLSRRPFSSEYRRRPERHICSVSPASRTTDLHPGDFRRRYPRSRRFCEPHGGHAMHSVRRAEPLYLPERSSIH